jgi:hypothetical protein
MASTGWLGSAFLILYGFSFLTASDGMAALQQYYHTEILGRSLWKSYKTDAKKITKL